MSDGERAAVEADIPDLGATKRQKEKKRSGVFWSWGGGGEGVSLFTLLGGDGDLAAARAWEALSNSISSFLRGGLAAAEAGGQAGGGAGYGLFGGLIKLLGTKGFLAACALAIAGFFAGLWALFHHKSGSASRDLDLSGISTSVRPHSGVDSVRLKFAGESANGQLQWGKPWNEKEPPKDAGKPEETKAPEEAQKPDETDWNDILGHAGDMGAAGDMKAAHLSGANLSTALGGRFGDKNVFAAFNTTNGGSALNKAPKLSAPKGAVASATSALRKFPAAARKYAMKGGQRFRSAFSPLAMAQLRLTNALSGQAANVTTTGGSDDTTKSLASDAFQQGVTAGGTLPNPGSGVPIGGAGTGMSNPPTVPPMGPGAPDLTNPPDATPVNMTPYQQGLDQAMQLIQQAAMLKMLGMLMIAIGAVLCCFALTRPAGIVLIIMGLFMLYMSHKLAAMAKQIGQQIQQAQEQMTQGNVVDQCADQATNLGTGLPQCKHDQAPDMHTNIRQDVDKERSAEWTWDSESGGGNNNGNKPKQ